MKHLCLVAGLLGSGASADVVVTFTEGAPADIFTIEVTDACFDGPMQLVIDLAGSAGGLIFDVQEGGPGTSVYQPFGLVAGEVTSRSVVSDGDTALDLDLPSLTIDSPVAFTIDLDDTVGTRGTMVSDAEITGAAVRMTRDGETTAGTFGAGATAIIGTAGCIS